MIYKVSRKESAEPTVITVGECGSNNADILLRTLTRQGLARGSLAMLDSPGTMRGEPVSTIKSMPKANGSGVDAEVSSPPAVVGLSSIPDCVSPHLAA